MWADAEWAAGKQVGITRTWSFEVDDFSSMLGHMFACFSSTCPTLKQRKGEFCPSGGCAWWIACPKVSLLLTSVYVCARARTSLEVSVMALRYICLFSARPSINDPAKLSSHCSQTALIHHYSALIGWISTSLPMRQAGGGMSWDKQLNSQIQSGKGGMQKGETGGGWNEKEW